MRYGLSSVLCFISWLATASLACAVDSPGEPVRLVVAGLTHTHVHWLFESDSRHDAFDIVGIVEPNRELARRYAEQHGFDLALVSDDLNGSLQEMAPDGVVAFGTTREHLEVVEAAAPRGIHVMVEKPLAVSLEDARTMQRLAAENGIHLLTNYETSWYPANHEAIRILQTGVLGPVRKAVFHHGHSGPAKLGVNSEFLEWLIDPDSGGSGALLDFGCYGANLMTWLMRDEAPLTVTAVGQQFQPDLYPLVEDEATLIVTYPSAQAIIQASWNWPLARKDMAVYGVTGQLRTLQRAGLLVRAGERFQQQRLDFPELGAPFNDPFMLFSQVIRGRERLKAWDPSGLENNLRVMQILQAGLDSMRSGETVVLQGD